MAAFGEDFPILTEESENAIVKFVLNSHMYSQDFFSNDGEDGEWTVYSTGITPFVKSLGESFIMPAIPCEDGSCLCLVILKVLMFSVR